MIDQVKPTILSEKCHSVELVEQFERIRFGSDHITIDVRDHIFVSGFREYVRGHMEKIDYGRVSKIRYTIVCMPFTNVETDIFGPLKVAMTNLGRCYGVISSCATIRSVHIEPVHSQTASAVFQALLNFVARRGMVFRSESQPGFGLYTEWIQLAVSPPWCGAFHERIVRIIEDTFMAIALGVIKEVIKSKNEAIRTVHISQR